MTRKHYQQIADVLAAEHSIDPDNFAVRNIVLSLADVFKQENPRFDRDRFYQAVGIEKG